MRKSVLFSCLLCLFAASATQAAILPSLTGPPKMVPIGVKSYVLMDFRTGRLLAEKNPDEPLAPASTTKLMTAYLVFQSLKRGQISLDTKFLVSKKAWQQGGSRMFLKLGSRVSVANLLKGMLVPSGNDAAMTLAQGIAGSASAFVQQMNQAARQLGLHDTHYTDPNGLPRPTLHTSALDLAKLSRAIIRQFPGYYHQFFAIKSFTWNHIKQYNYNKLLWRDPSVDGLKPGYVSAVGYNLAASAKRGNMRLIGVVMGADKAGASSPAQYINLANVTDALLDYGFQNFITRRLYRAHQQVLKASVAHGETDKVALGLRQPLFVTIPQGDYANLRAKVKLPGNIQAPIKKGQRVGHIEVRLHNKVIATAPLFALAPDKRYHFF